MVSVDDVISAFQHSQKGLRRNSAYFNATYRPQAVGLAVPPSMRCLLADIGWIREYIEAIEERLDIEGFRLGGQDKRDDRLWDWWQANRLDEKSGLVHREALKHGRAYIVISRLGGQDQRDHILWDWWQANRLDEKSGLVHREALKHGRAYIVISAPDTTDPLSDPTSPVIRGFSPQEMYAEVDKRTGRVLWAVRIISLNNGTPDIVTVYEPTKTTVYQRGALGWEVQGDVVEHKLGVVPVVVMLNDTDITDCNGKSEITRDLRSVTDAASRTMMNLQGAMELMGQPQRVLFGVDKNELVGKYKSEFDAYMANILAFSNEGSAYQFAAAELRNFIETMQELAKQFAAYTGLPPQYLSFNSDNPASAEAIRSSESRLVKKCERKAKLFEGAWEQAMRIAMLIMSSDNKIPKEAHRLETIWRDPATPTFAAISDGVVKLATAIVDGKPILHAELARRKIGMSEGEMNESEKLDQQTSQRVLESLLAPGNTGDGG